MLPSVVSRQVADSVAEFLRAAFPMNSPLFNQAAGDPEQPEHHTLEAFLQDPDTLLKGPYFSAQLPFRQSALPLDFFSQLRLPFPPHAHQARAFERLGGANPQPTLVATGTGSGKTECFMYPLLNHCAATAGAGVKAIIIYPMNALATDQASRFASAIASDPKLHGRVTVGLFVGDSDEFPSKVMGPKQVITDKPTLRQNPPDILLTNYKMLDYLLMRPVDQPLWRYNTPGCLRFLVVDELHTFDGAQGSDLACLVRRLKHHVAVDNGQFACVGTSATVGDELGQLLDYASQIFEQPFDDSAVIREDRLSAAEFLQDSPVRFSYFPEPDSQLEASSYADHHAYLNAQLALWFPAEDLVLPADLDCDTGREVRIRLGELMRQHSALHLLLADLQGGILTEHSCAERFAVMLSLPAVQARLLLQSWLALLALARSPVNESPEARAQRELAGKPRPVRPLVQLRSQLWLRELRRLVASVEKQPKLRFASDLLADEQTHHLPVVHCRDCHATGWASMRHGQSRQLETELDDIYRQFFDSGRALAMAFPDLSDKAVSGDHRHLCTQCLTLNRADKAACEQCGHEGLLRVLVPDLLKERKDTLVSSTDCPYCGSSKGLSIMGSRAASLSSVMIHQLYGSRFNEHKKLITFSDSVQDAAHRASFFTARTWPLVLRGQIASALPEQGELTLDAFAAAVLADAKARSQDEAEFVGRFIAPNMLWLNDYQTLVQDNVLPAGSDLPELVAKRLDWEVCSELTLRAGIGRTLENSGFACVAADCSLLDALLPPLHARWREELGDLMQSVTLEQVTHFVLGVLRHLIHAGAVMHPAFESYREDGGDTFRMMQRERTSRYMPTIGPRTRKPAYATFERNKSFSQLLGAKSNPSWYQHWLNLTLAQGERLFVSSVSETVLRQLLETLTKAGLMARFDSKRGEAWGIVPKALTVTREVSRLCCSDCRETLVAPSAQAWQWQGAPCMSLRCTGTYQLTAQASALRWDRLDVARVVGAEHTGLLTREVREATEQAFYRGTRAWQVNLLSATPTLEMGIDVGDLSSVLLCSVPPAQANYLQRIGRAGRKDGNALNITLAEGNPHDQFFFEEPLEMMQGQVQPPGVFLNAVAILERQLAAFCLDSWVRTGITPMAISPNVKQMLDEVERGKKERFPYNFLAFVEEQRVRLAADFAAVFADLEPQTLQQLHDYLMGLQAEHSLVLRIDKALQQLLEDRKSLKARIDKLKRSIDKLETGPRDQNFDSDMRDLHTERQALQALVSQINNKQTLNFLTDEGILPNYAFPEAGITLRSVLWRKNENEEGRSYQTATYEYERPASTALAELAPLNSFYAGGHKVEIEQIDLKVSEPEHWRLCSHCNHSENIDQNGDPHKYCPKCGTPGWADAGQKTTLLKLRQVYARASARDSQIGDESDSREPAFYQRQLLVSYEPKDVTAAYAISDGEVPFGFEFLSKVTLRDINFGKQTEDALELSIAGDIKRCSGFKVCLGCGMVQHPVNQDPRKEHDLSCKYKSTPEKAQFEDYLYLYRQLESEAVRILLPVSSYSSDPTVEASLGAAIQLGLKHYFKGSVDHLKGVVYREPENEGDSWRQYLVIYDTVPGGTGSLKELMREPDNLLQLLQLAYESLCDCGCNQDASKDGCYRCVYAYRERGKMQYVSRDKARLLVGQILAVRDKLQRINSINQIPLDTMMGSELEKRFIDVLAQSKELVVSRSYAHEGDGWIINTRSSPSLSWQLKTQVDLGPKQGVGILCRPDFVLYPLGHIAQCKPLAIFLDGFAFHKASVVDDVQKRQAIRDSGRYGVWTLTWRDLTQPGCKHLQDVLGLHHNLDMKAPQFYNRFHTTTFATLESEVRERNSFELLLTYVQDPRAQAQFWQKLAAAHAWVWLEVKKSQDAGICNKFAYEMHENAPAWREAQLLSDEPFVFGGLLDALASSQPFIELASVLPQRCLINPITPDQLHAALRLHLCFDDQNPLADNYERGLTGFWRLVNLLQWLPDMTFTSRNAVRNNIGQVPRPVDTLVTTATPDGTTSDATLDAGVLAQWQELAELEVLSQQQIVLLQRLPLPVPEVGYALQDDAGAIIAEADLAWPALHRAHCFIDDQQADAFIAQGWQLTHGELDAELIDTLTQLVTGGKA
ncbi:DEAD/DEAH box helicase [Aeromonas veronii]